MTRFIVLMVASFFASFSFAEVVVKDSKNGLSEFQKQLKTIKSYQAEFVQSTKDNLGNTLQKVEGLMQVSRPGKLRWVTKPPYEQMVVSDGKDLWIFDIDLEQVSIKPIGQKLVETPALLLSGNTESIANDFTVALSKKNGNRVYSLSPKDNSQLFELLEFAFDGDKLKQMRILDASGQVTEIKFSQVKHNPKLKDELFSFTPPEGVDVIDSRAPSY